MKVLWNKLSCQKGISVLIALIIFLVASMVSVVILSASVTSVKRVHDDQVQRQSYLAASSAAKLIGKYLSEQSCKITKTVAEDGSVSYDYEFTPDDGILSDELKKAFVRFKYNLRLDYESDEAAITVTPSKIDDEDVLPAAYLQFTMKHPDEEYEDESDNYKIVGTITVEGSDQQLYITAYNSEATAESSSSTVGTTTTEVKWDKVKTRTTEEEST